MALAGENPERSPAIGSVSELRQLTHLSVIFIRLRPLHESVDHSRLLALLASHDLHGNNCCSNTGSLDGMLLHTTGPWQKRSCQHSWAERLLRVRMPLCKGITLGLMIGLLYSLAMRDVASLMGSGSLSQNPPLPAASLANSSLATEWVSLDGPPLPGEERRIKLLLALWESSGRLQHPRASADPLVLEAQQSFQEMVLPPPHLQDCEEQGELYQTLDSRDKEGGRPAWPLWKGWLGEIPRDDAVEVDLTEQLVGNSTGLLWGTFPPWIEGSDEDNLPLTRRAQRDIWLLQHPRNCSHESVRFLVTDWQNRNKLGLGAEINRMAGMLGLAVIERRVLVFRDFNRADHGACRGRDRQRWSCYFAPETTGECRQRAELLMADHQALADETVLLGRKLRRSRHDVWKSMPPDLWGTPWDQVQPTAEVGGKLLVKHRSMHLRWWRAQATRYFMRFPSRYTCMLLNKARHEAFGVRAATRVLRSATQVRDDGLVKQADMEKWVWKSHKPWIPRPLLSLHVRQGDKAKEMRMVGFDGYMELANRLRKRFPQVHDIWLSTEMQSVIVASKAYPGWNFHYTRVPRQSHNTSMVEYETSIGLERSSTNALVNFLMASDADFFVGALGSSWCYLIDAMRSTGGKQMAGYLSVNKDRYWKRKS